MGEKAAGGAGAAGSKDEIKVLDDLLDATKDDAPQDHNFDKILTLIEKCKQMKQEEKIRSQRTNDYFQQLRDKLAESTAYLNKARKDLDNQQEATTKKLTELNSVEDYEALMKKSDEEIQEDLNQIRSQLDLLHSRVTQFNERSQNADEFYNKSLQTLQMINQSLEGEGEGECGDHQS